MKYLLTFAAVLTLSSCASIINGTSQLISFNSKPSGAQVFIDGQMMGATPMSVSLKKGKYSSIMFKKEGYTAVTQTLNKEFDPVAIINVFWDLSTTDVLTGAVRQYQPGSFYVELQKETE